MSGAAGVRTLHRYFCRDCRKKIPSGYHSGSPADTLAEIERNERLKSEFHQTFDYGKLRVDTEQRIFHIDNGYYRIRDLKEYSFYFGEPRVQGIFGHRIAHADVYFLFIIRNQERRVRIIAVSPCQYESTGTAVHYLPPEDMIRVKHLFRNLIEAETEFLKQKYGIDERGKHHDSPEIQRTDQPHMVAE